MQYFYQEDFLLIYIYSSPVLFIIFSLYGAKIQVIVSERYILLKKEKGRVVTKIGPNFS